MKQDTYRGDSIVRDYGVLNERYLFFEQEILICLADDVGPWLGSALLILIYYARMLIS